VLSARRPRPPIDDVAKVPFPDGVYRSELDVLRLLLADGVPAINLAEFVSAAWDTVEPSTPLRWNWHIDFLCYHVEAVLRGPPSAAVIPSLCPYTGRPWAWVQNLLINIPPGTAKSLIVSVFAWAWLWLWKPSAKGIYASANDTVSNRDSMRCRNLIESDWYQKTFRPPWKLSDDQNAKTLFATTAGGYRRATTTERKVTGERADHLFIDDPHDANDLSKAAIGAVTSWYSDAFANRLAQPETSTRLCIMQRLHEADLSAVLLEQGWAHVCLPMEYEKEGPGSGATFLGVKDPRTKEGELLMPSRFSLDVLYGKDGGPANVLGGEAKRLGSAGYAGQMQQRPVSAAGNRFKREWWRFYTRDGKQHPRPKGCTQAPPVLLPINAHFEEILGSWDCAFKDTDGSDFVVGIVVGRIGADKYVLARRRERLSFSETAKAVVQQRVDWPDMYEIVIEDKANGTAVLESLSSIISGLVPVEPKGGKEARAAAVEPQVEAGNVYLPEGAEWLDEWVDEFASFPRGRHDDQVDALTQALIKFGDEEVAHARALLGM
jgi:predicted phage terminase large subunit-like protein